MQNNCFKKIQKQPPEAFYKKVVVNSQYCEIFESTYFEEHLRKKKRLSIRNFYVYILYIKETSENVCFYFMKETSENAFFYSWLISFGVCIQIFISVMWWEINSKHSISTWVNQKKIKSSKKECVIRTWVKFWPMKKNFRKL